VAAAWLVVATLGIVVLAGEVWLRFEAWRDARASAAFQKSNVFFANAMDLQAGAHSLWKRRWRDYKPGARLDVEVGGERFVVEINSRGFRTHEFDVPRPPGLVRVVCLGGSTTVAGLTNDQTWPALLESRLKERYPGLAVEVLNLGISSVTTDYWLARIDRVLSFEPHVIVHYQAVNDISWRHLPRYAKEHRVRGFAYHSLLLQRLFPFPVESLDPYLDDTLATIEQIERIAREHGIAYLGATFAQPDPMRTRGDFRRHLDYNSEYWMRRFPMHGYATWSSIVAHYDERYVAFARRLHLPHVLVREQVSSPELFIDVCHFTPEGISRVADVFLPEVGHLVEGTDAWRAWKEAGQGP